MKLLGYVPAEWDAELIPGSTPAAPSAQALAGHAADAQPAGGRKAGPAASGTGLRPATSLMEAAMPPRDAAPLRPAPRGEVSAGGGRPPASGRQLEAESRQLAQEQRALAQSARHAPMRGSRAGLPAAGSRAKILAALAAQSTLVISGETGCGKSTQATWNNHVAIRRQSDVDHSVSIWQAYSRHMAHIWQAYGTHRASIWHAYGTHMARIWHA